MKKRKPLSALGKAQMEMAGSLTPDLEGQAHSRQHDGRGVRQEGIDWGRMHDDDRSTITPHLGRKGGEYEKQPLQYARVLERLLHIIVFIVL